MAVRSDVEFVDSNRCGLIVVDFDTLSDPRAQRGSASRGGVAERGGTRLTRSVSDDVDFDDTKGVLQE